MQSDAEQSVERNDQDQGDDEERTCRTSASTAGALWKDGTELGFARRRRFLFTQQSEG